MSWLYFQEDWALEHKVTFDGVEKKIYLSPNVTSFSVKDDIYSAWKEWVRIRDNAKYLPALRTIGGDPVGGGQYAGDIYFLINDWQIVVDHTVKVTGILYHDNPSLDPYVVLPGGGVTSTVSNLALAYNTSGGAATAADIWAYPSRTITTVIPTAAQIRQEIDTYSTKLAQLVSLVNALPTATQIRTEMDTNSTKLAQIKAILDSIDVPKINDGLTKTEFLALQ